MTGRGQIKDQIDSRRGELAERQDQASTVPPSHGPRRRDIRSGV